MEGVAGISRPPPTALSGERVQNPLLPAAFRWNTPPSVGRFRAVRSPSFTARSFQTERRLAALHVKADRAILKEGRPI
jgi:hypothetical protein